MHSGSTRFAQLAPGTPIGPFAVTVSTAANERYWRTVGADHPALRAGALYPPLAANLTVLTFQQTCPEAMIQTRQRLVCHRIGQAGILGGHRSEVARRAGWSRAPQGRKPGWSGTPGAAARRTMRHGHCRPP